MVGIEEEKGEEGAKTRFFGVFLLGATRFLPTGYDSSSGFTLGLSLGVKLYLSKNVGFRSTDVGLSTARERLIASWCCATPTLFGTRRSRLTSRREVARIGTHLIFGHV